MADFTSISIAIATVKNILEIIETTKDIDQLLEKSELKIKIVELRDALIDARNERLNVQELIQEKDNKIADMADKLKFKAKLVRQNDKYYEIDENENISGDPYCLRCWESEQKPLHLLKIEEDRFRCADCKNIFGKNKRPVSSSGSY